MKRGPLSPWFEKIEGLAAIAAVAWFFLITVYFFRSNLPLIHNEQQLLGVFSGLWGSWSFSMAQTPLLECAMALFHVLLTTAFGALLLRILRISARWPAFIALSFAIGFGVSGVAFELLTMAGCLYTPAVWCVWVLLIGCSGFLAWKNRDRIDLIDRGDRGEGSDGDKVVWWIAVVVIALITITTFWHALFFPETYWDSLILYLGYGRMTFLQHAFPFKAEAQVGIGLGANYPHLYSNYAAVASTMFHHWSDLHARFVAPLAGLGATILIYETARELWKRPVFAAMTALLFRAVPNGIAYSTYASDYAFAILFTAAFIYCITIYTKTNRRGWLLMSALIPGIAMNLNYLMGVLWVVWAFAILLIYVLRAGAVAAALRMLIREKCIWAALACGIAIGAPWYIRNTVLTNNPAYAFFPQIFTKSVRVNPEVLASANLEWFRNGDGVGRVAEFIHDFHSKGGERDVGADDFQREATLRDRIAGSFLYWAGFETVRFETKGDEFRVGLWRDRITHLLKIFSEDPTQTRRISDTIAVLRWQHSYKMMVLMPGIFVPVLLLALLRGLGRSGNGGECASPDFAVRAVTLGAAAALSLALLAYEYLLADFYLYQIIAVLVPATVLGSSLLFLVGRLPRTSKVLLPIVYSLVIVQGIAPGLAFGLMGFKFSGARMMGGVLYTQTNLGAFRHPGISSAEFYRLQYGEDPDMWDYVNEHLKNQKLLTHENRHYVFDPSITLIHLDDWEMQKGYDPESPQVTAYFLQKHDVHYYLRTPNEANHKINERMGMDAVVKAGLAKEVFRAGDNILYELGTSP